MSGLPGSLLWRCCIDWMARPSAAGRRVASTALTPETSSCVTRKGWSGTASRSAKATVYFLAGAGGGVFGGRCQSPLTVCVTPGPATLILSSPMKVMAVAPSSPYRAGTACVHWWPRSPVCVPGAGPRKERTPGLVHPSLTTRGAREVVRHARVQPKVHVHGDGERKRQVRQALERPVLQRAAGEHTCHTHGRPPSWWATAACRRRESPQLRS